MACDGGDLYWLDGCGEREDVAERCGALGCRRERCVQPPVGPRCEDLSENGRCEGNVLRYCRLGVATTVDCAATGMHCGVDLDGGAMCLRGVRSPCAELPAGGACRGNNVARCIGDRVVEQACGPLGACVVKGGAHCLTEHRVFTIGPIAADVNVCRRGPDAPIGAEVCDGFDNDRNGLVDDGVSCPTIPLVFYVLSDENGRPIDTRERLQQDVDRANEVFAAPGNDTGLRLSLRDVQPIVRPLWIEADDTAFDEALRDPALLPRDFAVPIVITQTMLLGGKGHPGVSTLPNDTCADLDFPHAGEDGRGVIMMTRERNPTTLAHELGHYFGLCHTQETAYVPDVEQWTDGKRALRCPDCDRSGDGICDTAPDPGPDNGCTLDSVKCTVSCAGVSVPPDANDIMSYYVACRTHFTAEQSTHLRRYLARRMAWHACLVNPQSCVCDASATASCDAAKMQRCSRALPISAAAFCRPDGSGMRGNVCRDDLDCEAGLVCAGGPEHVMPLCRPMCGSGCQCLPSSNACAL
jgi:hypothetical protein